VAREKLEKTILYFLLKIELLTFHKQVTITIQFTTEPRFLVGAVYLDFPATLLQQRTEPIATIPRSPALRGPAPVLENIREAAMILAAAKNPLVIVGKGCAWGRAENSVRRLIETTGLPFLPTPMGKGVIDDSDPRYSLRTVQGRRRGRMMIFRLDATFLPN